MRTYPNLSSRLVILLVLSVMMFTLPAVISAQDNTETGTPIEITGAISQINGSNLMVAGFLVDASSITLDTSVTVGISVTVTGHLIPGNVIVAESVVVVIVTPPVESTPEATPESTPEGTPEATTTPTPTDNPIIVIEGPVVNIVNNIITVYNFNVEVAPNHPILNIIQVGDVVHIEGAPDSTGVIVASVVSNIVTTTTVSAGSSAATVGLDGPVDAIDGNTVTVNGIPVQFRPDDPILKNLQVGNFVSVQGNFSGTGNTIILVVINVTVFNDITIINNTCWYDPGMGMGMGMGHWHCDGMGMGMGDDGMGMGMGG
jgi:Domain of unknown function (DUF5666)